MAVVDIKNTNFQGEVVESEKPVILDFYADWCMPCKMSKPMFEELSNKFEGRVKFGKINVDQNNALADRFSISAIPCFIIVKNNMVVDRHEGMIDVDELKHKLETLTKTK